MTAKRDSKRKPKKDERPKREEKKLKDLSPGDTADEIVGGAVPVKGNTKGAGDEAQIIAVLIGL